MSKTKENKYKLWSNINCDTYSQKIKKKNLDWVHIVKAVHMWLWIMWMNEYVHVFVTGKSHIGMFDFCGSKWLALMTLSVNKDEGYKHIKKKL